MVLELDFSVTDAESPGILTKCRFQDSRSGKDSRLHLCKILSDVDATEPLGTTCYYDIFIWYYQELTEKHSSRVIILDIKIWVLMPD